jgi:hypothetical protein
VETRRSHPRRNIDEIARDIKISTLPKAIVMIVLPEFIWNQLLREFRRSRKRVEQVAYLDGIDTGAVAIVTTITLPNATLGRGNFSVAAESMSEAGQHLGPLARIAQVHTHPGEWVGHSGVDNDLAYSQHDSAVSIVLPNYGKSVRTIFDAGIHLCKNNNWRALSVSEKGSFLRIVPTLLDFRKKWL